MGASLTRPALRLDGGAPYRRLVGVGGIGTGTFFALDGDHDLGRNESRPARLLDVRDYCKLHIIAHYPAVLLGAQAGGEPFHVLPIGKVGRDDPGRGLRATMEAAGMDLRFVGEVAGRPTLQSVCFQYPDGSGGNITTRDSAAATLTTADVVAGAELLDGRAIALAAPEAPLEARHDFLRLAGARGALRVAGLASAEMPEAHRMGLFAHVDLLALNQDEAEALAQAPFDLGSPEAFLVLCADRLTAAQPAVRIAVTAGRNGAFGFERGRWVHVPALDVPVASTAGAGDALLGGVLTALALGVPFTAPDSRGRSLPDGPITSALEFGVLLSAFKVTSPHTIHPDADLTHLLAFAREHGVSLGNGFGAME
ncbi:MAG TPA: PfkB family carbohydrate kinase [Vicinamibacteria bacterium]